MHLVEEVWLASRRQYPFFRSMPEQLEAFAGTYQETFHEPLPLQVVAPSWVISGVVMVMLAERGAFQVDPQQSMQLVNRMGYLGSCWMAYRESKHIYEFTPELTKELARLRQPLDYPIESLDIPRRCIVLDYSAYFGKSHRDSHIMVTYDAWTDDDPKQMENPQKPELVLNISRINRDREGYHLTRIIQLPVQVEGDSIFGAFKRSMQGGADHLRKIINEMKADQEAGVVANAKTRAGMIDHWEREHARYMHDINAGSEGIIDRYPVLPLVINSLLYLRGDSDIVKEVHPGRRPDPKRARQHQKVNQEKRNHKIDVSDPFVIPVGEKFTAAIKQFEVEREKLRGQGAPAGQKPPHLREPHLHKYRVGEGRKGISLKFLPWIGVHMEVPEGMRDAIVSRTPVE